MSGTNSSGPLRAVQWSDSTGTAPVRPNARPMHILDTRPTIAKPYRMAAFGDSRLSGHTGGSAIEIGQSGASAVNKASQRIPMWVELYLSDTEYALNFGVSGDPASGWNALARTSGKTIIALNNYAPDVVLIQYGINDYIAGTSAATVTGFLMGLISHCLAFGAKVIFEATNIASAASYGASSATKLATTLAGNALMQTFCNGFPDRVVYVDNNSWIADGTTFADVAWMTDGTHFNEDGAHRAGAAIAAAARAILPRRDALTYAASSVSPNLIPWSGAGPTMFTANEIGTCTASAPTWNIDPVGGEPCAEVTFTCATLAGGYARCRFEIHAAGISGATPTNPIYSGDRLQGSVRLVMDNGAGANAQYQSITIRHRLYSDSKFSDLAGPASAPIALKLYSPSGRAFIPQFVTATASAGISAIGSGAGYPLQILIEQNAVGQVTRLRLYAPALRVLSSNSVAIAPAAAGTVTVNAAKTATVNITLPAGNITIAAPANPALNIRMDFVILQDGGGSRTITWNAVFKKAADGAGTANQVGATSFVYNGTNWVQVGGALAFA